MFRNVADKLKKWREMTFKKPLLITGAPQVGKTELIREFGADNYYRTVYIDLRKNDDVKRLFDTRLDTDMFIYNLTGMFHITERPKNVLIIFDNVQFFPEALNWLERMNDITLEHNVIFAGTISDDQLYNLSNNTEVVKLYPLSFDEFLFNLEHKKLYEILKDGNLGRIDAFADIYTHLLRQYLFVGGMPEAVRCIIETQDYAEVRKVQRSILDTYRECISQLSPKALSSKASLVWNSIPKHLSNKTGRFKYEIIKNGARAADYDRAIKALCNLGLAYKIERVTNPIMPLKDCANYKAFKLYPIDVGLLSCMFDISETALSNNDMLSSHNGILAEQFVLQQLLSNCNYDIFYYTNSRNNCYIPFLLDDGKNAVPVDIMLKDNSKTKRLKIYQEKYNPPFSFRLTHESQHKEYDGIKLVPLYTSLNIYKHNIY